MNRPLRKVTFWHILWFLVYIAPFIAWLCMAISNQGIQVNNRASMDSMFIGFQYVIDRNNIFLNWFVDVYKVISQNSSFAFAPNIESFLIIICYWFVMVSFFRLIVDIALMIPRLCHSMLHKLSRESEKDL